MALSWSASGPGTAARVSLDGACGPAVAAAGVGGRGRARSVGRALVARLVASGERVVDVPADLSARSHVFDTGQGRKTDSHDAHAIVMVALR